MDILTTPIAVIAQYGVVGAIAIGALAIAFYLFRKVEALQDKRVEDAREFQRLVEANTVSRDAHTNTLLGIQKTLDSMTLPRGRASR